MPPTTPRSSAARPREAPSRSHSHSFSASARAAGASAARANRQLAADATSRAASAARIVAEPLPAPKESKAAPRDIESSRAEVEVLEVAAVPSAAEVMRPSC